MHYSVRCATLPPSTAPVAGVDHGTPRTQRIRSDRIGHRHRPRPPPTTPTVVAQRGHLPGLRPQLRRRQRRRHGRPRRRPLPAPLPARPRCRRDLVHALVRLAARRRRLRRRRLPRDRSGLRHPRGGRGAHRRGARARHPDDHRHRPQPRLRSARLVPGRARRRPGRSRARALLVPAGPRSGRRRAADRLAVRIPRRQDLDPHDEPRRHARASGTCTCSPRSSRTSTGTTRTSARSTRRSCASGSTGARPASASTRPRCWSRTRRCRRSRRSRCRGRIRSTTATSSTTSTAAGAPSRTPTPGTASSSARSGSRTSSGSPATSGRTSCTPPSTSTSWPGRGTPPACATSIDAHARGARAGRSAGDVGAVESRRHPAGHSLRPRGLVVRLRPQAVGTPTDPVLGRRRARAAALLTAALPGSLYIYQGDELGLDEVEVPLEEIQDPMHARSGGVDPGRDGCRVPLPWSGDARPFGFSPDGATSRPVAHPAGALGRPDRRASGRRPGLDAPPVPRRRLRLRRDGGRPRGRATDVGGVRPERARVRARRATSSASPTCPATRCRCRPTRRSCWPARMSRTVTFRPTRRSGCARTVPSRRSQRGGCPPTNADQGHSARVRADHPSWEGTTRGETR